jgi:hypothetical protein
VTSDKRLADRAQAGIAGNVAVAVVEQLEMIDIDHHQRERLTALAGAASIRARARGRSRAGWRAAEAVEARQLVEMRVSNLQFLLALGELGGHVVERNRKRLELGDPRFLRCPHVQIAAAETRRRAHQRSDRPHHQLLAAEPGDQRTNMPNKPSCK